MDDRSPTTEKAAAIRGWQARLAIWSMAYLLFLTLTGLLIWLAPFSVTNQVAVLVHTGVGVAFMQARHVEPEDLREEAKIALHEAYQTGACIII